jgi:hypothetical protein
MKDSCFDSEAHTAQQHDCTIFKINFKFFYYNSVEIYCDTPERGRKATKYNLFKKSKEAMRSVLDN